MTNVVLQYQLIQAPVVTEKATDDQQKRNSYTFRVPVSANKVETRNLSAQIRNAFAVITLSSLDGKPLDLSNRILMTTTGREENTGQKWDERGSNLTVWGIAPTLIEPITGWVTLKGLEGAVGVFAQPLDGSARPIGKEIAGKMIEPGWEIPVGTPATTSYLIRVER